MYRPYGPPEGHIRPPPPAQRPAPGEGSREEGGGSAPPTGQPGEYVVGYDLQVVRTTGTLVPLASGDVLVTYYIDRTGPTGVYRPPERPYRMCDIICISIDPADHIMVKILGQIR